MERFNPTEYFPEKSEKKLRKISHKKIGVSSEMCISDNTPNRYSKSCGRRKKSADGIGTRFQNRTTIPSALSPNAHVPRSALHFKDDRPVSLLGNATCISRQNAREGARDISPHAIRAHPRQKSRPRSATAKASPPSGLILFGERQKASAKHQGSAIARNRLTKEISSASY